MRFLLRVIVDDKEEEDEEEVFFLDFETEGCDEGDASLVGDGNESDLRLPTDREGFVDEVR